MTLTEEDYNILKLIRSESVGSATFQKLIAFFGNATSAIKNIDLFKTRKQIVLASDNDIKTEIEETEKYGAKILTYTTTEYPQSLKAITDFPPVIIAIGNTELLSKKAIAIIGARNASANGCNFAKKIAKEVGLNNYVIVSGMATGIDTSAHWGSLETGTIAVLGGGIDNIYPKENQSLYENIRDKGCIITEIPIHSPPKAENFPARNRIITALSLGVVVIEAAYKSGTINTVRLGTEQGKEIMVMPGNPYDPRCEGSNALIRDGAMVVLSSDDILYNIDNNYKPKQEIIKNEVKEEIEVFDDKNPNAIILDKLNYTPIEIEILAEELKMNVNVLSSCITELELEGKIVVEFGKIRKNL